MADYQAHLAELDALGASVYALTTDPADKVKETIAKNGITYPILYEMDGPKTAEVLGAYYEERRNIIQPTNFILDPDHKIVNLSYASGPVGRITASDAILHIEFVKKKAAGVK